MVRFWLESSDEGFERSHRKSSSAAFLEGRRCVSVNLHDGAATAVAVAFDVLDCQGDSGGFGEGFVHAAVLHC